MTKNEEIVKSKPKLVGGIGKINFGKQYRQGNRVYDSNGIAMCLTAQPRWKRRGEIVICIWLKQINCNI